MTNKWYNLPKGHIAEIAISFYGNCIYAGPFDYDTKVFLPSLGKPRIRVRAGKR